MYLRKADVYLHGCRLRPISPHQRSAAAPLRVGESNKTLVLLNRRQRRSSPFLKLEMIKLWSEELLNTSGKF